MRLPISIMSSTEKLVWAVLNRFAGKNGKCYPSQERLAEEIGMSVDVIKRALSRLEENGFIRKIKPTGKDRLLHRHNSYEFLWHEIYEYDLMYEEDEALSAQGGLAPSGDSGLAPSLDRADSPPLYKKVNNKKDHIKKDHKEGREIPTQNISKLCDQIMGYWNDSFTGTPIPLIQKITSKRKEHIRTRLSDLPTIDKWQDVIDKIHDCSFLMGENDRQWVISFDWLITNDTNWVKVIEGKYLDKKPNKSKRNSIDNFETDPEIDRINDENIAKLGMEFVL